MKKHLTTIIIVIMLLIGLSLLLYPTVSDYLNHLSQTRVLELFREELEQLSVEDYTELLEAAHEYNRRLLTKGGRFVMSEEDLLEYHSMLSFNGRGVIGSLEIEAIDVNLPVYLGTSEGAMQIGIGHLEGSSLPVGGLGTHSVVTGHRGLPSSILLTNADRLIEGDIFVLRILKEALSYQIETIVIVEPEDFSYLGIFPDRDLSTLLTCTPYGINSHRMLLIGSRVFPEDGDVVVPRRVVPVGAQRLNRVVGYVFASIPILLIVLIYKLVRRKFFKGKEVGTDDR